MLFLKAETSGGRFCRLNERYTISETTGSCDLEYVASATAAQGTGSDVHTVVSELWERSESNVQTVGSNYL